MKTIITSTVELDDNIWGISDLIDGREITKEVKEEIKDLFLEDGGELLSKENLTVTVKR